MCSQGCLVEKARQGKEVWKTLYRIRKTEPFLRVVTPLTQVKIRLSPLKNPAAQLKKDYVTNIKQIH